MPEHPMDKDSQDRQIRNIKHADNPCIGDYWHEMFTAIVRILRVDTDNVILQHLPSYAGKEISDTDPEPELMPRENVLAECYSPAPHKYDTDSSKDIREMPSSPDSQTPIFFEILCGLLLSSANKYDDGLGSSHSPSRPTGYRRDAVFS
jgi:hypothetical protein